MASTADGAGYVTVAAASKTCVPCPSRRVFGSSTNQVASQQEPELSFGPQLVPRT